MGALRPPAAHPSTTSDPLLILARSLTHPLLENLVPLGISMTDGQRQTQGRKHGEKRLNLGSWEGLDSRWESLQGRDWILETGVGGEGPGDGGVGGLCGEGAGGGDIKE